MGTDCSRGSHKLLLPIHTVRHIAYTDTKSMSDSHRVNTPTENLALSVSCESWKDNGTLEL